jgi:hypothetical protein
MRDNFEGRQCHGQCSLVSVIPLLWKQGRTLGSAVNCSEVLQNIESRDFSTLWRYVLRGPLPLHMFEGSPASPASGKNSFKIKIKMLIEH